MDKNLKQVHKATTLCTVYPYSPFLFPLLFPSHASPTPSLCLSRYSAHAHMDTFQAH